MTIGSTESYSTLFYLIFFLISTHVFCRLGCWTFLCVCVCVCVSIFFAPEKFRYRQCLVVLVCGLS